MLEVVNQLKSLGELSEDGNREVFNYNAVFKTVKQLPEYYKPQFNVYYVQQYQLRNNGIEFNGRASFELLLLFLSSQIQTLELGYMSENLDTAVHVKREPTKSVNLKHSVAELKVDGCS